MLIVPLTVIEQFVHVTLDLLVIHWLNVIRLKKLRIVRVTVSVDIV